VLAGERVSPGEALELYRRPLAELGQLANARRDLAKEKSYDGHGREIVTYIIDRNINLHECLQRLLQILRVLTGRKKTRTITS